MDKLIPEAGFSAPRLLPKTTVRQRFGEWLALLRIGLNPACNRSDLTYNLLAQRHVMGDDTLFINLGYWEKASNLDQAAIELADILAARAELMPEDRILDVGFGFADQDIHWAQSLGLLQLKGINVSPLQVSLAQQRVASLGLSDRIQLLLGDAVDTRFSSNSFDKIVGLECAFHFCTRKAFFAEAYRLLKPGGRLALSDFIARDNSRKTLKHSVASFLGCHSWQIPKYNLYPISQYIEELESIGFENIRVENINRQVFDPFVAYQRDRFDSENFKQRYHPLIRLVAKLQIDWGFLDCLDYILITADKEPQRSKTRG